MTSRPPRPQDRSASAPAGPSAAQARILLRPPLDGLAAVLAIPGVAAGKAGPGWAEIRVGGHPVRLGAEALEQAVAVAEPDRWSWISDEDDWVEWLLAAAAASGRRPAARRAVGQVVVAAAAAALPRPVPEAVAGGRIVLRIGRQWFDQLAQAAPNDVAVLTTTREQLSRSLGIPLPAVEIRAEELPPRVFGFLLGDLALPLRAAPAYATASSALEPIARGLVTEVRRWADALVGPEQAGQMMTAIGEALPELAGAVRELVPPQRLLEGIRTLLAQHIPVAAMDAVLERLLSAAVAQVTQDELAGYLRAGLGRQLAAAAGNGRRDIPAYILARTPGPDEPWQDAGMLAPPADPWQDTVLVTPPGSAAGIWAAIRAQAPGLLVIARDELPAACRVSALAAPAGEDPGVPR